jgi:Ca2+-binding EF-hand superfamily protein
MCYLTGVCPEEDEVKPEEVFNEFDNNNDGNLSNTEFSIIYYLYCMECEQTLNEIIQQYDEDDDYLLSLEEYTKFSCEVLGVCGCNHEGNVCAPIAWSVFQEFDTNTDGLLNTYEFAFVYNAHCNYDKTIYDL